MKQWKIQKFAGDVIWDLRQRRLLPIVALLGIGLVIVPVVLAGGESATAPVDPAGIATVDAPEIQSAVVAYDSGLRDYKRRLKELSQTDPFEQHFAPVPETSGALAGALNPGGETPPPASNPSKKVRYVTYSTDLVVGEDGNNPEIRNNLTEATFLPDETTQVVVFLGVSSDGGGAVFLVSSDVTASSGDGQCEVGCTLLLLKPGETRTLEYTPPSAITATYHLTVTKIERHVSTRAGASGASTKSGGLAGAFAPVQTPAP